MGYLVIGLLIGFTADRYIIPMFDMLLEILSHKANKVATSIQIDTGLMSIDYQEISDQGKPLTPVVGFLGDSQNGDIYYDDEDDEQDRSKKIGFIK
jgi:hypothetical protein